MSLKAVLVRCRTGLTALTVSLWFFVSLFFGPILCELSKSPLTHLAEPITHMCMPSANVVSILSLPALSIVVAS